MILAGLVLILAGILTAWWAMGRPLPTGWARSDGSSVSNTNPGQPRVAAGPTLTGGMRAIELPTVQDDAAPLEFTDLDEREREATRALIRRVETGLSTDDPNRWPDAARARAALDAASTELEQAEVSAELGAIRMGGGVSATARVETAVTALLAAAQHRGPREEVLTLLGRVILVRARARRDRHFREAVVAASRLAIEATSVKPGYAPAQVLHIRTLVAAGRLDTARHALVERMRERPDDVDLLRTRARWLVAHGDRVGAVDAIERYLDRLQGAAADVEAIRAARLLGEMRRHAEATPHWERLVERQPAASEAWAGLARSLAEARQWEAAERAARRAVEILPDRESRDLLARVMGRTTTPEGASA